MKLTTIALVFALSVTSITVQAEGSTQHSGQASKHSSLAAGHSVASTAQIASAVAAVPLMSVGSVALTAGAASVQTGSSIANSVTNLKHQGSLVITETTITADPSPDKVMDTQRKQTTVQNP